MSLLNFKSSKLAVALSACALSLSLSFVADACTRAAYHNGDASIVVRTMDWYGHDDAVVKGHGKGIVYQADDSDNGLIYISKYPSIRIHSFVPGVVSEAMNDQGLMASMLYLADESNQFQVDSSAKPNVNAYHFVEFAVGGFSSVQGVLNALGKIDVVPGVICDLPGHEGECLENTPVHFALSDKSGHNAVIEFINGEAKIYEGRDARAMSNDPTFDQHLALEAQDYEAKGSISSIDRRARAVAAINDMYERDVKDADKAMLSMKGVGATVFAGYDKLDYEVNNVFPTLWTVYGDLNKGEYMLDRYDTWEVEKYNFEMFESGLPFIKELGKHPDAN